MEAAAQILVTGNFKHIRPLGFFRGIEILTPREFLDKYFPAVQLTLVFEKLIYAWTASTRSRRPSVSNSQTVRT